MLDYPSSPTVGQVANGKTWTGTTWDNPGFLIAGEPSAGNDGKHYIFSDGNWTLKREASTFPGGTNAFFTVPTGAVLAKFKFNASAAVNGTPFSLSLRCSEDGATYKAGASDYSYTGSYHNTGSTAYATLAQVNAAQAALSNSHSHSGIDMMVEGFLAVKRPSTLGLFGGNVTAYSYYNAAANLYMTGNWRFWLNTNFISNRLTNLYFFSSAANTMADPFIDVEWTY
jgi:hypothetical protein